MRDRQYIKDSEEKMKEISIEEESDPSAGVESKAFKIIECSHEQAWECPV